MARPARIFLAAELLLGIAYFLLPDSLLRAVVYCTLGLGMVVAVVVGTRLHRPAQPLAWYLLAGGQLSFTVGDAINYTYQWVLEVEPPYPSVADGFYLACYALLAGGLLLLIRERAPGRDLASLIDATIIRSVLVPAAMKLLGDGIGAERGVGSDEVIGLIEETLADYDLAVFVSANAVEWRAPA